jgi:tetrahydromethanopterin S-methyltransferase subunit A
MSSTFKQVYPIRKKALPEPFNGVNSLLQKGMRLTKCRKCGCMHTTLKNLLSSLPLINDDGARDLLNNVKEWLKELEPMEYSCFKCKYCIPPEAMSILTSNFPSITASTLSSCEFEVNKNTWPPVAGEYIVLNKSAPVAVSTLASDKLTEELAKLKPVGLCVAGKTETENIGIDKIIKNVVTNPAINFMIIAGRDPEGHKSGETLLALWENGVDESMRVIGSTGRRPILKNVSFTEVEAFRRQIQIDNMIGCKDVKILANRVKELSERKDILRSKDSVVSVGSSSDCGCHEECHDQPSVAKIEPRFRVTATVPRIKATKPKAVKLDRAGYFVIIPSKETGIITVEHYSYDNKLLRTIEGKNSRDIYLTIINNKWVTDLAHAAYLGKELAKAELSIKKGFRFIQDGA